MTEVGVVTVVTVQGIKVRCDPAKRSIWLNDKPVGRLVDSEWQIFYIIFSNPDVVITYDAIRALMPGWEHCKQNVIALHVCKLRKRLEACQSNILAKGIIRNKRKKGYVLSNLQK